MHSSMPQKSYSIQLLYTSHGSSTYVIREKDNFGEYPNIYAKVYHDPNHIPTAIILSDSGTGLNSKEGANIAKFLAATINPNHTAPYTILTTHCHYDHICGIQSLLDANAKVRVLSSSHDLSYLTPWRNLQKHSLCEGKGLIAPRYDAHWVDDGQSVTYLDGNRLQQSSITVIHTPGHTPDSIAWYDRESLALCVGDTFYERESDETRSGSHGYWAREPPQPVIFTDDSRIIDWNASMRRLLDFVRAENRRLETERNTAISAREKQNGFGTSLAFEGVPDDDEDDWTLIALTTSPSRKRVVLCAAHVTVATDAETALLDMLNFMFRIQLDQVPRRNVQSPTGRTDIWLWDDCLESNERGSENGVRSCRYSVRAPWSFVHGPSKW